MDNGLKHGGPKPEQAIHFTTMYWPDDHPDITKRSRPASTCVQEMNKWLKAHDGVMVEIIRRDVLVSKDGCLKEILLWYREKE